MLSQPCTVLAQEGEDSPTYSKHDKRLSISLSEEERAWLRAHPDIKLGYTDAFEPAVIVNKDGSYRGTLVDFLELLNQRLGTDFKITIKPIPDVINQVGRRELAGILSLHPHYADELGLLQTQAYMSSYPTIFTRKGFAFTTPADLSGKKIAVIDKVFSSRNVVNLYGEGTTIIKVENALEGLKLVKNGTVDLFIGSSRNSYLLGKYQFFDLSATFQLYDLPTPNIMAIRSDWPQLVSILNKGLSSISVEETEAILRKWVIVSEQTKTIELTDAEQDWLAQGHEVRVRNADWPPYMIVKENEPPQGIAADYLNLIKKRTGVNFEYEVSKQPFAKFLEAMKQRSGPDMTLIIARTPAREEYFSFTTPYITAASVIFVHEEDELIVDITGLAGKALAVPRGYNVQNILVEDFPDIKLVLFDSDYDALKAVALHKADAYIGNLIVASHITQKYGLSGLKVVAPAPPGEQKLSMGIRKDWPELTSIIDKALASITEEEKTAMNNKYIALRYEKRIDSTLVVRWILIVVVIATAMLLLVLFWNWQLRLKVRARTADLEVEIEERIQAEEKILDHQQRLKALASQLVIVEEKERSRIAANLHDHIGQTLAFSRIQIAKAKKYASEEKLADILDEISQSLLQTLRDTKELVFDLSSPLLNELGIYAAISHWLEENISNKHGIAFELVGNEVSSPLTKNVQSILFRNVRELLTNVIRHAQASKVIVSLVDNVTELQIVVSDDGVGFEAQELKEFKGGLKKFGLFSIREQMEDMGGSLEIFSEPGKGCKAMLSIPLDSNDQKATLEI